MSQTLARRARIKDLSNKAEGIFQYVGNDNVLFRLISTGNKLTSDVNYAVALFTGFARSHQLGSQETRRTIDSIYRRVGELMCLIDIVHAAAMAQLPEGFLPQTYTGNPGACAIACEMALRMGVSHLFVMQNLYVVHGMPTWSGKSCKALIDNSGQFAGRTRYRMEGEEGTDNWGCRLIGVDKLTGEKVEGPKVTVKMAKDSGWWNKNGSYWPKMTEMMLKYRAAAYFARAECPEVLMGANIDYEVGAGDAEEEGAANA